MAAHYYFAIFDLKYQLKISAVKANVGMLALRIDEYAPHNFKLKVLSSHAEPFLFTELQLNDVSC